MSTDADLLVLERATTLARSDRVGLRPIFVVDADPDARRIVDACLASLQLMNPTVALTDGSQTIQALRATLELGPSQQPVLLLLDLDVARCPGLEVLQWMRAIPALGRMPVIVLSEADDAATVTEAYRLGVRSYLVKPSGFEALGSVIRELELPWSLT